MTWVHLLVLAAILAAAAFVPAIVLDLRDRRADRLTRKRLRADLTAAERREYEIGQAVRLANEDRASSILDLIAANEIRRDDPDLWLREGGAAS